MNDNKFKLRIYFDPDFNLVPSELGFFTLDSVQCFLLQRVDYDADFR